MKDDLTCLRCGGEMGYIRREKIQLGQTGWILGDWPNLLAGAMEVHIYCCKECGRLEFFRGDEEGPEERDHMAQVTCPRCGKRHDMDYPKCPFCGYDYIKR